MMNKKIRISLIVAAAVVLVAVVFFANPWGETASRVSQRCRWGDGLSESLLYDLGYRSWQRRQLTPFMDSSGSEPSPAEWVESLGLLNATLVVQESEHPGCSAWVAIEKVSQVATTLNGETLATPIGELTGGRGLVRWDDSGALVELSFANDTPTSLQNVLSAILTELQVLLPDPGEMKTARGLATTRTRGADLAWSRTKLSYGEVTGLPVATGKQETTGEARIRLLPSGAIEQIADTEHLLVFDPNGAQILEAKQEVELEYLGKRATQQLVHGPLNLHRRVGEPIVDDATRQKALEARAAGLSGRQLLATVRGFDGTSPPSSDFLWQATGRLLAEPELSDELARAIALPMVSQPSRELALDLLAHTGHAEAQAAMRVALSSEAVKANEAGRVLLLQRFSFVKAPTPETVAFLRGHYDGAESVTAEVRRAATYALGSVAGHLIDLGEAERARSIVERFHVDLGSATELADATALLAGMGNAHDPNSQELLVAQSYSENASVRAGAATALRHFEEEEATRCLVELVGDSSSIVQRSAMGALHGRRLGAEALRSLRDHVKEGRSQSLNDAMWVGLVADYTESPDIREALALVLARSSSDARLRGRIRNMLDRRK